jgi:hypothetical protein
MKRGCGFGGTTSTHEILDSGRHAERMIWMMAMRRQSQVYVVCILRKSSVKRHIQNIHGGNANLVSFVDYLADRKSVSTGQFFPRLIKRNTMKLTIRYALKYRTYKVRYVEVEQISITHHNII